MGFVATELAQVLFFHRTKDLFVPTFNARHVRNSPPKWRGGSDSCPAPSLHCCLL